ncbi:hypothetical protein E4T42_05751 [Aureobasidium subglaciale]|nr:hypothetical protein E4T42_05751 [Aureobasidium subglaciale]
MVATNPIFLLDDGQDYLEDIKEAMVKHMCGMHYGKSPGNTPHSCKVLVITSYAVLVLAPTYHIAVFTAADRYDCVTVRRAALEAFGICLSQIRISPRSQTNPDALSEAEVAFKQPLLSVSVLLGFTLHPEAEFAEVGEKTDGLVMQSASAFGEVFGGLASGCPN